MSSQPLGPGTYLVQRDAAGKLALFKADDMPVGDNPEFGTTGDAKLIFKIADLPDLELLSFDDVPIVWSHITGQAIPFNPEGNIPYLLGQNKVLELNIKNPDHERSLCFDLVFVDSGEEKVISFYVSPELLDPTIVEKPAQPSPP